MEMRSRTWLLMFGLAFAGCSDSTEPTATKKQASHPEVSLAGSNFEIDTDANLKVDDSSPSIDWASVAETRKADLASGSGDDSFGQGTKEDTAVPTVVDGSIPPNKSDLKNFGVYLETAASGKFLHMFWHRVQDPTGTTNMDFEFNQSSTTSANGVTPTRTSGDLLIQYDLANGGTNPKLFLSRWIDGTEGATAADCEASNRLPCWDSKVDLTAQGDATGSINASSIPTSEADGLGAIDPRTFGEATVDFDAIVPPGTCTSFGSAYLKSRSSDSFTAALKDFIAPTSLSISNCGTVKVVKIDDSGSDPPVKLQGAAFSLVQDDTPVGGSPGAEDTEVATCDTDSNGACTFTNVLQGNYWLVETSPPAGHDLPATPYQAVVVTADQTVTKTFIDPRQRGAIKITKTRKHAASGAGDHPHAGVTFTVNGVTAQTDSNGVACFDNLLFGTYSVAESTPAGYQGEAPKDVVVDNKAACADATYVGETVSFANTPLSSISVSFSSAVEGGTKAKISCAGLTATPADATPDAWDDSSESFLGLIPGTYSCTVVIDP